MFFENFAKYCSKDHSSLFNISKWLWPESSKKTVEGPATSKLYLKQQDSIVQFKTTESLESVLSGASC